MEGTARVRCAYCGKEVRVSLDKLYTVSDKKRELKADLEKAVKKRFARHLKHDHREEMVGLLDRVTNKCYFCMRRNWKQDASCHTNDCGLLESTVKQQAKNMVNLEDFNSFDFTSKGAH